MSRSEQSILNAALVSVSALPETMVWRNNTGMAWAGKKMRVGVGSMIRVLPGMVVLTEARPINFGLLGSADVLGVSRGRAIALEAKALLGSQQEAQKKFEKAFTAAGGTYGIFKHEDDAVAIVRGIE